MTTHVNVLRIVLVDPPMSFDGMDDVVPMLDEKGGARLGLGDQDGNVRFETCYTCKQETFGPAIRWEKDGRPFVYVDWYGTKGGKKMRFRRLKVHPDRVPTLLCDSDDPRCP